MAFSHGTSITKIDTTVGTLPAIRAYVCKEGSCIPPNLADAAQLLIELFKANGDLAWLADMVGEAEVDHDVSTGKQEARDLFHFMRPSVAEEIMESMRESHDCQIPDSLHGLYSKLALQAKI